jgi:hypothetical protein
MSHLLWFQYGTKNAYVTQSRKNSRERTVMLYKLYKKNRPKSIISISDSRSSLEKERDTLISIIRDTFGGDDLSPDDFDIKELNDAE